LLRFAIATSRSVGAALLRAHLCHICTGTGLTPCHICTGTRLQLLSTVKKIDRHETAVLNQLTDAQQRCRPQRGGCVGARRLVLSALSADVASLRRWRRHVAFARRLPPGVLLVA
jgi:hypothetical protein